LGWSKLKDAGKGINNAVSGVGKNTLATTGEKLATAEIAIATEVGEHGLTKVVTSGQKLITSGQKLISSAWKYGGCQIAETGLREGLNKAADTLSHFALEKFQPQISSTIQSKVRDNFLSHI